MLGMSVSDPEGVEGGGTMRGMGLLPLSTVFAGDKRQVRATGTLSQVGGVLADLSGVAVEGYEIHMGRTEPVAIGGRDGASVSEVSSETPRSASSPSAQKLCSSHNNEEVGVQRVSSGTSETEPIALYNEGNVYGTYLHGVFDTAECASALVGALMRAKGLDPSDVKTFDLDAYKQEQYDKLADVMRANLDMDLIYRIVEEGV